MPSKIVCVGRNYAAHATELGNDVPDEMVVFCKPSSAISEQLVSHVEGEAVHFETEICFLVKEGNFTSVGVGLDLTRRDKQRELKSKGLPWERCKAFDGSALFSEFVPFAGDFSSLALSLHIDGKVAQQGGVSLMLFPPNAILQDLSTWMKLDDDDVVMTGTPAGVGAVRAGSVYEARVSSGDTVLASARWVAQ